MATKMPKTDVFRHIHEAPHYAEDERLLPCRIRKFLNMLIAHRGTAYFLAPALPQTEGFRHLCGAPMMPKTKDFCHTHRGCPYFMVSLMLKTESF